MLDGELALTILHLHCTSMDKVVKARYIELQLKIRVLKFDILCLI